MGGHCAADGCENKAWSRGYCSKHYSRICRRGAINPIPGDPQRRLTDVEVAEIIAAVRRFENPLTVAKRYGINDGSVRELMKRTGGES